MNVRDIIAEDRRKLVDKLIENMKNGEVLFKKGWDINILSPQNPVSSAVYQGGNRLRLIEAAIENEYSDPRWLTFKQAQEKGWKIKKGSKGILCEKWIFTKKEKELDKETGKMIEVEKKLDKPVASYFTVFNASQIEGIPPFKGNELNDEEKLKVANDFIRSSECPIKEIAQDKAYYSPFNDEIVLPLRESFRSEQAFIRTTIHEMGHSTGHPSRLNRDQINSFGTPGYAKEELVAELTSVFVQAKLGLKLEGEHFNNHTAYLKSWISVLENDPNELFRAASQAEKAMDRLYENYLALDKSKDNIIEKNTTQENTLISKDEKNELERTPVKRFFNTLRIDLDYSEKNLGVKDDTTIRGAKAYEFLKRMIDADAVQNDIKKRIDKGEDLPHAYYYKVSLALQYQDYKTGKIRIDLGDLEFGGKTKVSDALEYRLKSWPKEMLDRKEAFAEYKNVPVKEIENLAHKTLEHIDKIMTTFREQEKLYIEKKLEREKPIENNKNKDYWRIEFNEHSEGIKNYANLILTKELLKEIKDLDNKLHKENEGIYKFYFEHIKNNEVIDKGRIDVGTRDIESFKYLEDKLNELEKENVWANKLAKDMGNNLEVATTSNNSWANKLAKDNLQLTLGK